MKNQNIFRSLHFLKGLILLQICMYLFMCTFILFVLQLTYIVATSLPNNLANKLILLKKFKTTKPTRNPVLGEFQYLRRMMSFEIFETCTTYKAVIYNFLTPFRDSHMLPYLLTTFRKSLIKVSCEDIKKTFISVFKRTPM